MRANDKRQMAIDIMNHFGENKLVTRKQIVEFWTKNQKNPKKKNYPFYSFVTTNDEFNVEHGKKKFNMKKINKVFPEFVQKEQKTTKPKIDTMAKLLDALGANKKITKTKTKSSKKVVNVLKPQIKERDINNFMYDDGSDLVDYVRNGNYL